MKIRILVGTASALLVAGVVLAGDLAIMAAVSLVAVMAVLEYCKAMETAGYKPVRLLCVLGGALLWPAGWLLETGRTGIGGVLAGACLLWLISAVWAMIRFNQLSIADLAVTWLGLLYIPGGLLFLSLLLTLAQGRSWMILLLAGTIATDTLAYFTGVLVGKHHVLRLISPKKTLEGVIGGAAGGFLVVILVGGLLQRSDILEGSTGLWMGLGALIGTTAQLGDWMASWFKRKAGVKDFGALLPGHGGILDRCDSFLLSAPAVFFYIFFLTGGGRIS